MNIVRIIFAFMLMLGIYGGSNFYIARRLYQALHFPFPHITIWIYSGVYTLIALSMFLGFMPFPYAIKKIFTWISGYWFGIFVYFLLFFLAADVIIISGRLIKLVPGSLAQNLQFYKGIFAVLCTCLVIVYGIYNAHKIIHVSYDITLKNTPLANEIKIVLISDTHLGAVNSEKNLSKMVHMINDLEPDIVCIPGDIFNDDFNAIQNPEKAKELFKTIKATYGVYACLGNHDGGKSFGEMLRFLEQSNIKLLNDESATIDNRLVLIGRVDSSPIGGFGGLKRKDMADVLALIDTTLPIVVMDHSPGGIGHYGSEIDLILAGHTHKGQIFPGNLFTNAMFAVDYGQYQKDDTGSQVIVTSGAGTWGPPMRIGTYNEIVSIVLH